MITDLRHVDLCLKLYNRQLTTAMAKFDPQLLESQDAGWRGMVQYYETGGGLGDTWGAFPSK